MIPVTDTVPVRRPSYVTLGLIGACLLAFLWELSLGPHLDGAVRRYGVVPRLLFLALAGDPRVPGEVWLTLFTHQFLHAGWAHLLGNMLFLWIFGDNVEDRLGHLPYLGFYLACGAGAALVQAAITPTSTVPMVGASGAIAGVLGAYLVFYPAATVVALVPAFLFLLPVEIPAVIFLPFWFVTQLLSGLAAITRVPATGGTAFWAHAGGFLLGAAGALALKSTIPGPGRYHALHQPVPWAARLASALADMVASLLLVRFFLVMLAPQTRGLGQYLINLLFAFTEPLVAPFAEFAPALRLNRVELELSSLVAAVALHLLGGVLGWAITAATHFWQRPKPRWPGPGSAG